MKRFAVQANLLFLAALAGVVTAGCGSGFSKRHDAPAGVFRWAVPSDITTLDPAISSDARVLDYLRQVFEGLVTLDSEGKVQPCLAKSWEIDPTGKLYTFHLLPGVRFSDGNSFTAEDVKFTFDRAFQKQFSGSLVPFYLGDIEAVKIVDAMTIRISLKQPKKSFLSKLAYPVSGILCSRSTPKDKVIDKPGEMIGAGPFVPVSLAPEGLFVLKANPFYHGPAPRLKRIEIRFVKNPATRLNLFRVGETDLTMIQNSDLPGVVGDPKLSAALHLSPRADLTYLQFNATTFPPLVNAKVRRALAMAIDRDWIANKILGGVPTVASGIVPTTVPGIDRSEKAIEFDPAAARRLLAEAGYPDGKGFPPLELAFLDQQRDHPAIDAIVTMWRHSLGIQVSGRAFAAGALLEKNLHHQLACFYTGWTGDYPDPEDYLSSLFLSDSPANGSGYRNPELDRLLHAADVEQNPTKRSHAYGEAETNILQDCPIAPLFFVREAELISSRLAGLQYSPFGHLSLASVLAK